MRVDVDGVRLAVRVWPAEVEGAVPVVLLPATGETAHDWDVVAAELSHDRTVYAVDLRGHGESDWPGEYSIELMAHDVAGLLDRLPVTRVDLVGHSLGGLAACLAVVRRPSLVRRLVLEDVPLPRPRTPSPPERPGGELAFDWAVVEQVRPQVDDPHPGWPEVMAAIRVPTLVVGGGDTSPVPQAHVRDLVDVLPDGELRSIDAGHLVHATRPEQFLAAVTAFLDA